MDDLLGFTASLMFRYLLDAIEPDLSYTMRAYEIFRFKAYKILVIISVLMHLTILDDINKIRCIAE